MGEFKDYTYNKKLEKELLDNWCKRKTFFRIWRVVVIVAWVAAMIIAASLDIYVLAKSIVEGFFDWMMILMVVLIPACVSIFPLLIWGVKLELRRIYGRPFELRQRQYLRLYDSKVEYGFFYGKPEEDKGDKLSIYTISYDKLRKMTYDEKYQILTLTGEGELRTHSASFRGNIDENEGGRKFYEDSDFSLILCFDKPLEILEKLEKLQKEKNIVFSRVQDCERNYSY